MVALSLYPLPAWVIDHEEHEDQKSTKIRKGLEGLIAGR
jgi:hypothetical protein